MAIFEIHIHGDFAQAEKKLEKILQELQPLKPMAKKIDDLLAKQDQIDAAVSNVRQDVQFIKDQLAAGSENGLTAEEVQTLEARVDQTLANLNALDSETDSSTPNPETPTEPQP